MNEKDMYKQKLHAKLNTLKRDIAKLKARVSASQSIDQIAMDKQVIALEHKLVDFQDKLTLANEEECDSIRKDVESDWNSLKERYRI